MAMKNDLQPKSDSESDLDINKCDTMSHLIVAPEFAGKINVDLSASIDERWEAARDNENHSKARFAALGLLLLSLKKDMAHGEFLPELERRGFENRQSQRAMAYASYVFSQPKPQQMRLLEMPVTKVAVLAQADPEVVEELMGGDDEKMASLSVRELARRVANLEAQLEIEQGKAKRLGASQQKKRLTNFEPRTEEIRAECMALQLEAELPINGLQKLFEEVLVEHETAPTPESRLRVEQVWAAAHIVAAGVFDMISKLGDLAASTPDGNDLPRRVLGTHILTPEEAQEWLLSKNMIQNKHEATKAQRKEAAEAAKPKGPGRRLGSKNKVGE